MSRTARHAPFFIIGLLRTSEDRQTEVRFLDPSIGNTIFLSASFVTAFILLQSLPLLLMAIRFHSLQRPLTRVYGERWYQIDARGGGGGGGWFVPEQQHGQASHSGEIGPLGQCGAVHKHVLPENAHLIHLDKTSPSRRGRSLKNEHHGSVLSDPRSCAWTIAGKCASGRWVLASKSAGWKHCNI